MTQKDSHIQRYAPEVQQATTDIIRQLPAEINSLALQAKIAEAIVARSEARILKAIDEALAYRSSPAPTTPAKADNSVKIGDINIKVDCSQTTNYWVDASQHYTDNSQHNYWQDNSRRCIDNSDNSSHSSSSDVCGFELPGVLWLVLGALILAGLASSPCVQNYERQHQQQLQQQGGSLL